MAIETFINPAHAAAMQREGGADAGLEGVRGRAQLRRIGLTARQSS